MSIDLESLRINVKGIDLPEVEAIGRRIYAELYLQSAIRGVLNTHDGLEVFFYADAFDHGFYTASEWKYVVDQGHHR